MRIPPAAGGKVPNTCCFEICSRCQACEHVSVARLCDPRQWNSSSSSVINKGVSECQQVL
jgi:hypothetical protein